jgi:UDP-2-acetamido-2,6-beta-L-arabino-hexul-4-ose reductase
MKVLITGADGFLGKNLRLRLAEHVDIDAVSFTRRNEISQLSSLLSGVDFVFHLAGVNRPDDPQEFVTGNVELTRALCAAISGCGRKVPIVYTSSTQAPLDNPYGRSKRAAESLLFDLQRVRGTPVHVFRLTNVFGKWCRPNYNSVIATFCYNVARDRPIRISDEKALLQVVYVDDVIARFMQLMDGADGTAEGEGFETITPQYTITLGGLAEQIQAFRESRVNLMTERVGVGLTRALYSTYLSYVPTSSFAYRLPQHSDVRGVFVEMLKTPDCGQISYFTAQPGVTRGGHYHHSKTEKFLVIKGHARFRFRHLDKGETFELVTSGDRAEIIETVPGWAHDITNMGHEEMIVVLWANEVFDRSKPDTYSCAL